MSTRSSGRAGGSTSPCVALISGGGTAGHVLPALAIAEGLAARGHPRAALHYVGARRGIETRLVPPSGFPHTFLGVTGLQRRLTMSNVAMPFKLLSATYSAWRLVRRLRPQVAVSVGGYASLPAMFAARLGRVPIVVVSYDLRPGWASKLVARFATVCALGFDGIDLPRSVLTGAPLRQSIITADPVTDRAAARRLLGLPADRFVIGVTGGSQGAGALNAVVAELVQRWAARTDVAVRHVAGERFLDQASPAHDGKTGILYQVIGYEDQMPAVYVAADVMLTRAGASTIAELAAVGVPAIVVPWPLAADDHQTENARLLTEPGAAIAIAEAEFGVDRLVAEIEALIGDPARRMAMAAAARTEGARHRSGRLIEVIDNVAQQRSGAAPSASSQPGTILQPGTDSPPSSAQTRDMLGKDDIDGY